MNNERRAELKKAITHLDDARTIVEQIRDDEQDSYDNMPEGLQSSSKGERLEEITDQLSETASTIEQCVTDIEQAME